MKALKITAIALFLLLVIQLGAAYSQTKPAARDTSSVKDTIINKVTHRLYVGPKGGKYIIVTSKSGSVYRRYFPKK